MFEYIYKIYNIIEDHIHQLLGIGVPRVDLTPINMGLRALLIYLIGIILVRISTKRIAGKPTTFDIMIVLILGSILSRAVNGDAPMIATIVSTFALVLAHYILSFLTFYFSLAGAFLKGKPTVLIEDGKIHRQNLRNSLISENDLLSALRLKGKAYPDEVKLAVLERNGEISVIPFNPCKCERDTRDIEVYKS